MNNEFFILKKKHFFQFLIALFFYHNIPGQIIFDLPNTNTPNESNLQYRYRHTLPWRHSPFVNFSASFPFSTKMDFGQNIGTMLAIGFSVTKFQNWPNFKTSRKGGIFFMIKLPVEQIKVPYYHSNLTPYFYYNYGTDFNLFGGNDSYKQWLIGAMIQLRPWLNLRPELGLCTTDEHLSGGAAVFGSSPEVRNSQTSFMGNIGLEFNLLGAFKKRNESLKQQYQMQ